MSAVNFDALKQIPEMLEAIKELKKEVIELKQHIKPKYDLSKRNGVLKYLNISDSTISKYIKEGTFKEGYHYYREIKGRKSIITYVSGAIEEYKRENPKKEKAK